MQKCENSENAKMGKRSRRKPCKKCEKSKPKIFQQTKRKNVKMVKTQM